MYNNLKRKRVIKTLKEVKQLVSCIEKYGLKVIRIGKGYYSSLEAYKLTNHYTGLSDSIIFQEKDTKLEITCYYGPELCKPCTYIFDLNDEDIFSVSGQQCFAEFNKYYHIPKAAEYENPEINNEFDDTTGKYVCSASPLLGFNEKYNNQELYDCYEYDLNSAYANVLLRKIPDLTKPKYNCKVGKNEVGFLLDDECSMIQIIGYTADVVFPLIDCPEGVKKFINKYYNIKKLAKSGSIEKLNAKAKLNLPIGYCQRYNPFLRAYVVHNCNKLIKLVKDENTLFWNTDAIFSKTRRPELEIGKEIGQWKEVKCETLRYKYNTYQINDEIPVYRGIPKNWFKAFEKQNGRAFNLLIDEIPTRRNKYEWDWEKLELREINYEKEII